MNTKYILLASIIGVTLISCSGVVSKSNSADVVCSSPLSPPLKPISTYILAPMMSYNFNYSSSVSNNILPLSFWQFGSLQWKSDLHNTFVDHMLNGNQIVEVIIHNVVLNLGNSLESAPILSTI